MAGIAFQPNSKIGKVSCIINFYSGSTVAKIPGVGFYF